MCYAEVVLKGRSRMMEAISVSRETAKDIMIRLLTSLVGLIWWEGVFDSIGVLCEACGISNVLTSRLGGSLVLLSFECLDTVQLILEEFKVDFAKF